MAACTRLATLATAVALCVPALAAPAPASPAQGVPSSRAAGTAAAADASPCPGPGAEAGWTLSTSTLDPAFFRHAFVGNGYLGQRVPPAGMGYVATGEKTGWPLYTPRYDGAFVTGLYAQDPQLAGGRQAIAAIPTWSTLTVGADGETYSAATPAGRISAFSQALFMRCGLLRTALTWTTSGGKATDLVYEVVADQADAHVGAVRLRMTPHWSGDATVTDAIDGAGARRLVQTGGGGQGSATVDVAFAAQTVGTAGAVASTLTHDRGVDPSSSTRTPAANLTVSQTLKFPVRAGQTYELAKFVGVDTALTSAGPEKSAVKASQDGAKGGWSHLLSDQVAAWAALWRCCRASGRAATPASARSG
jgi:trehalose/maltose hydrolase-like predicted phosphorylase